MQAACATLILVASAATAAQPQTTTKPHVVLILSDDLGYNDLGYKNGNKTITPSIDALVSTGISLSHYHTFKLCSPTRASIQSGRYPWGVGFYDMDDSRFGDSFHCINPDTTLLPALMKKQGYETHAIGKWDVGYIKRHCLPTERGYDTFLGYYTACTSDYWYHGAPGGNLTYSKCGGVDFHDSKGDDIAGAAMSGPNSLNNTYDQVVFTQRAVELISAHGPTGAPMYLFIAYHNVHDTCQGGGGTRLGLNAPMDTVERYSTTKLDTWKVQGAMTTELDYGVGNVTRALESAGMMDNTVMILISDNGGPLDHSTNYPLRGGKGSLWEGGVRVEGWVHSPLLAPSQRGTTWSGLAHSSDWYVTLVEGIAGAPPGTATEGTGPRRADGVNLWPALLGTNLTSPRTEVVHRVQNQYFNTTLGDAGSMAARFGDWKIMVGVDASTSQIWQAWPAVGDESIQFGNSGGQLEEGTDHARCASLPKDDAWWAAHTSTGELVRVPSQQRLQQRAAGAAGQTFAPSARHGPADPKCKTGLIADFHNHGTVVCCPEECGVCGASDECQLPVKDGKPCPCANRKGGADACCVSKIQESRAMCAETGPPCVVSYNHTKPTHQIINLYNLVEDPTERNNLANDPTQQERVKSLLARLLAIGATGPPLASAFPADVGMKNSTATAEGCAIEGASGYLLPLDWKKVV